MHNTLKRLKVIDLVKLRDETTVGSLQERESALMGWRETFFFRRLGLATDVLREVEYTESIT